MATRPSPPPFVRSPAPVIDERPFVHPSPHPSRNLPSHRPRAGPWKTKGAHHSYPGPLSGRARTPSPEIEPVVAAIMRPRCKTSAMARGEVSCGAYATAGGCRRRSGSSRELPLLPAETYASLRRQAGPFVDQGKKGFEELYGGDGEGANAEKEKRKEIKRDAAARSVFKTHGMAGQESISELLTPCATCHTHAKDYVTRMSAGRLVEVFVGIQAGIEMSWEEGGGVTILPRSIL
ncbi:hypothetical protein HPB50_022879 [Hyalomma asiaticum]|uniref:Uncharacterized protein n=1 Tax=Hyalomma asiaticum TaxID=266040 RepID=A0ACB7SJP2_HYAAI|nr:hypothetical protein HPB50_022879 [Hyalomma asiaticum]